MLYFTFKSVNPLFTAVMIIEEIIAQVAATNEPADTYLVM